MPRAIPVLDGWPAVRPLLAQGYGAMLLKQRNLVDPKRTPFGVPSTTSFYLTLLRRNPTWASRPVSCASGADLPSDELEGPSTDPAVIFTRLQKLGLPFWTTSEIAVRARWKLAGVVALTLATTGVSVAFNYLGRDFFNALAEKDTAAFTVQLTKYLGAFFVGIPIFVLRTYYQNKLGLEWREWMTEQFMSDYLAKRTFYQVQAATMVDNPDQRISIDIKVFTDTTLGFALTLLNAVVDLVSFSEILYSIYPPLFVALLIYSLGGTGISVALGQSLVGLNFRQEAREADLRYGLVRIRENAESIAFYGGEKNEGNLILQRLFSAINNFQDLLVASRNLDFFTSFYRFLIQLLPAAVVAPLFFQGKIEFGVITQSQSAFNHILNDVSLVVYQFEALAGYSAVVDRLGEFQEAMDSCKLDQPDYAGNIRMTLTDAPLDVDSRQPLMEIENLTLVTPDRNKTLVKNLSLQVEKGESYFITGPSGVGKTSLLRAIAGLWTFGEGHIILRGTPISSSSQEGSVMFVPQRPYMVLGTLRDQLLYPTWSGVPADKDSSRQAQGNGAELVGARPIPTDAELEAMLETVRLGDVLLKCRDGFPGVNPFDVNADWAGRLSLGEQQRLAFARIFLASPSLVLMDESTSALDMENQSLLYKGLQSRGVTFVSIGHRPSLKEFHKYTLHLLPAANGRSSEWKLDKTPRNAEVVAKAL